MHALTIADVETLVARAARGDRDAFSRIVDATRSLVSSIAMAIVRDVDASHDIAQEVYLAAWRDMRKLRSPQSLLPWLRQMTRNRANQELRTRIRRRALTPSTNLDDLLEVATDGKTHDAALVEQESHARLAAAIDALPDEAREVVTLYYREGRSARQVADLLGLREDAVKQRLSRARARLRDSVLDELGDTLRATAPGAAFTAGVMALTLASPPVAAAATLGSAAKLGGSVSATPALLALLGAIPGIAGGALGVTLGLRPLKRAARDDRERAALDGLERDALISVVGCAVAFPLGHVLVGHDAVTVVTFLIFLASLYYNYMVRLPRIIEPRLALERLEDPTSAARHRRDVLRRWFGFGLGSVLGTAGLIAGIWLK